MIRKFEPADMPIVLNIWLQSNLEVHSFIPVTYWTSHLGYMKRVLPEAELYVYEREKQVVAFVGLEKDYIAGIFIQQEFRSRGIGKELLTFLKRTHASLTLSVYDKNPKAIQFYLREDFRAVSSGVDSETLEKEWLMQWRKH